MLQQHQVAAVYCFRDLFDYFKTIDNDLGVIDRSFGFNTAVEEAGKAIVSAKTEAECAPNGIGIVKLMGTMQLSGVLLCCQALCPPMVYYATPNLDSSCRPECWFYFSICNYLIARCRFMPGKQGKDA